MSRKSCHTDANGFSVRADKTAPSASSIGFRSSASEASSVEKSNFPSLRELVTVLYPTIWTRVWPQYPDESHALRAACDPERRQ
jgi:hypothetical protein